MIKCIVNNGTDGEPEVPLWLCPCPECTKLDWEALISDGEGLLLREHRHECFPEFWDANGREIRPDVQSSATVGIGGGDTITCEIVYRSEGWVPRFTVTGGARRETLGQAHNTLVASGVTPATASVLLTHAQAMAVAK